LIGNILVLLALKTHSSFLELIKPIFVRLIFHLCLVKLSAFKLYQSKIGLNIPWSSRKNASGASKITDRLFSLKEKISLAHSASSKHIIPNLSSFLCFNERLVPNMILLFSNKFTLFSSKNNFIYFSCS